MAMIVYNPSFLRS